MTRHCLPKAFVGDRDLVLPLKSGRIEMKKLLATIWLLFVLGEAHGADRIRLSVSSVDAAFLSAGIALKRGFFQARNRRSFA